MALSEETSVFIMLGFSNYHAGKLCRVNNVGILSVNIFHFLYVLPINTAK